MNFISEFNLLQFISETDILKCQIGCYTRSSASCHHILINNGLCFASRVRPIYYTNLLILTNTLIEWTLITN